MKEFEKTVSEGKVQPVSDIHPFFSVIIPIYNKKPHIARAVTSVLNQNFKDFELILIDDASSDGSSEEIQKFDDIRIRRIRRDQPGPGGYAARNLGVREARAEWVAFLDADDEWYPDHLEKMFNLALEFPEAGFLSCGWKNIYTDNAVKLDKFYANHSCAGKKQLSLEDYLKSFNDLEKPVYTSVMVAQKKIATNIFPERILKRGGDIYAFFVLMTKTTMAWSPHLGAIYYRNSQNMVTKTAPSNLELVVMVRNLLVQKIGYNQFLLNKTLNRIIYDAYLVSVSVGGEKFSLPSEFYWKGDFVFCAKMFTKQALKRILPKPFQGFLRKFIKVLVN